MKHIFSIFAAVLFTGSVFAAEYVKTDFANIKATDEVIVTMEKGGIVYAMSQEKSSQNNPAAVEVTVASDKVTTENAVLVWNIVQAGDSCVIYPAGDAEKWLYCNKSSNAIRLGTGDAKGFQIKDDGAGLDYLFNKTFQSYVGVSNSSDWRHYTTIGTAIKNEVLAFFTKPGSGTGIENTAVETKAVKTIVNGKLVIENNGVRYNALGQKIQ